MAVPADFDAYDISQDMKRLLARSVTELEQENKTLVDKFRDLQAEADSLNLIRGNLVKQGRTLKQKRDRNLAAIQEIYDKLPMIPTP